jgi:uncharacterized protein YjbJ (UPF0337 family)
MNWDTMQGDWKQFKGKVKEQWGKLTDDDLNRIEGKRDQLAGAIQKRYGIEKDEAEQQVKAFEDKCGQCEHEGARMESGSHGRQSQPMNPAGHDPAHNPNREKSATAMKNRIVGKTNRLKAMIRNSRRVKALSGPWKRRREPKSTWKANSPAARSSIRRGNGLRNSRSLTE